MRSSKIRTLAFCCATTAGFYYPLAGHSATFTVSASDWGTTTQVNSFAWALDQANSTPGADTISITPGLAINVDNATEISGGWLTPSRATAPPWSAIPAS
jgi:hypothetical protein